jgi:hypothetical protein
MLLGAFNQMKAGELMERTRPGDAVRATDTIADMVRAHPRHHPETPLPVFDEAGALVGIVTTGAAEHLLQGTWPTTPVTALMMQTGSANMIGVETQLTEVLAMVEARRGTPLEEQHIPVVEDGMLVGSVDPARLLPFTQVGEEFGMNNVEREGAPKTFLGRLGAILPAAIVIAAMAIVGNIALRTDPAELRDLTAGDTEANITFSNRQPADGAFLGLGGTRISVDLQSTRPISDVTILLNGSPLETVLSGNEPLTRTTASALVPSLLLGSHNVTVRASTTSGRNKADSWSFRVTSSGQAEEEPAGGEAPDTSVIEVLSYKPVLGRRVLGGSANVPVILEVQSGSAPSSVKLLVDGQELQTRVEAVEDVEGRYRISGTLPDAILGVHRVSVQVQGEGSRVLSEWTFSALAPGEDLAYFEATGYFVGQPFLDFWQQNGGLAVFGYPISERVIETDEATGHFYTALYFERARFELHPDLGNRVILGRLGAILHEPEAAAQPREGARFFAETDHNVSGKFLEYWNTNGGLAVFGYPISEERFEKNPVDGKEYLVQYFERSRFELHPEHAGTVGEVLLGQLGLELYGQKYLVQGD